jgi:hypothetical protein
MADPVMPRDPSAGGEGRFSVTWPVAVIHPTPEAELK